jgi:hypothetical protein
MLFNLDYAREVADSALTTDVLNLLKLNENPMNIILITGIETA